MQARLWGKDLHLRWTGAGLRCAMKTRSQRRSSGRRELIAPRGDKRYVRRNVRGQFKESDDVSRSLSQDRRRKATTRAKAGQGDRGDR